MWQKSLIQKLVQPWLLEIVGVLENAIKVLLLLLAAHHLHFWNFLQTLWTRSYNRINVSIYMCLSPDLQRTSKVPICLKIPFCQSKNRNKNCRQHFSILVSVNNNEGSKRGKLIFTISNNWHYFDKFDIINLFYRHWIPRYQLPLAI